MRHEELTSKILETCFEVSNELGVGYIESVYENALFVALVQKGMEVQRQVPLKVTFRGVIVGDFKADILVEGKVLLELKAVEALAKEHFAQVLNYLKTTGIEVGMVINFGKSRLQYRRFENRFDRETTSIKSIQEFRDE
ncbi:MAG: GxxExxY protein [Pyrinomonadaceae bacterium]|nr:GxxExxY protein [Pyrinomonadaceae bacterium]MBP6214225.1 GxxExxY protein [Pyrinomonadaceae bacterium]